MIPAAKLTDYIAHGIIQIAPLAFMPDTPSNAVIILDEAQTLPNSKLKCFSPHGLRLKNDNYRRFDANRPVYFAKIGVERCFGNFENVKGISMEFNQKTLYGTN